MRYSVEGNDLTTIWSNNLVRHYHSLNELFSCTIPVNSKFKLTAVFIQFETSETSPDDTLDICIFNSDKDYLYYTVKLGDIQSGVPVKLDTDKKHIFDKFVNLSIKYTSVDKGSVSIGINEKGPCITVVGGAIDEFEISYKPLISIVTPVYNDNLEYFKKTYESVLGQVYELWEWVIVEDCSKNKAIRTFLKSIKNEKIKIFFNKKNEGIVESSNKAIANTVGEYVTFLDDDDLLDPASLLYVADAIDKDRNLKLIYTDEDKVTCDGAYVDQFFKPDWSYDMLLSQNYVCHLGVYKGSLIRKLNGFNPLYEGSQDYDMALMFAERVWESEIKHIPKILYHWRKEDSSTSSNIANKPYAHLSALLALEAHLGRKGEHKATVTVGKYMGTYKVDYPVKKGIKINIIIPTRDNPVYLETCIQSVFQSTYTDYSITIVNNRSKDDETLELLNCLNSDLNIKVLEYDKPFNYSAINNYAVGESSPADVYLFLNDDTEVITRDWMERLLQHIWRNNVAVAGPKLLYSDNRIQHAGVIIGIGGVAGHSHKHAPDGLPGYFTRPHLTQNISAVTGACLMISSKVFHAVGGFEEKLPKAFNDIDLCLKVRKAGFNIVYNPHACLYHHESVSRGLDNGMEPDFVKAIDYMQNKWDCRNFKDPYYNPNLTLISENFSYMIG